MYIKKKKKRKWWNLNHKMKDSLWEKGEQNRRRRGEMAM